MGALFSSVETVLQQMKKSSDFIWKMGNATVARVIVGVLKRSHFSENWLKNVSFSWKRTQIGLIFMKNEAKRYHFCEKWTKKVSFLWKMSQKGLIFRKKWVKKVSFSWKKCTKKVSFFVKNYSKRSHFHEKKWTKHVSFAIVVPTN